MSTNVGQIRSLPGALENKDQVQRRSPTVPENLFREQLGSLSKSVPGQSEAKVETASGLKFSNHAVDRMQMRGIRFTPEQMSKIEGAVGKAQAKGARETLLLTDNAALIVSIKDKTVVTVMDKASLKENVFTNIDSTVMI